MYHNNLKNFRYLATRGHWVFYCLFNKHPTPKNVFSEEEKIVEIRMFFIPPLRFLHVNWNNTLWK